MTDAFVKETCRPYTLTCCRYLLMSGVGWRCGKLTELRSVIDGRVAGGDFKATGDNCDGVPDQNSPTQVVTKH